MEKPSQPGLSVRPLRGSAPFPGPAGCTGSGTLARCGLRNKEPATRLCTAFAPVTNALLRPCPDAYTALSVCAHRPFLIRCALAPGPICFGPGVRGGMREEDVPAQQPEAKEDPWVSQPDAHSRRPRRDCSPAQQGPRQSLCLIWRIRDRAEFRAVARARRRRQGPVEVTSCVLGSSTEPPRVAYAVGRNVGNAVVRNRVRRRLRAAVAKHVQALTPGWGYLVRASASAADMTFSELDDAVRATLRAHREDSL